MTRNSDREIARRVVLFGLTCPRDQWERKIAEVLREMREGVK